MLLLRRIASNPVVFLLLFAMVGVATVPQLGVPVDDYTQYVIGQGNYHVLTGEKTVQDMDADMRFYGPAFETFCYAIDSLFYGEPDTLQKFWMRHGLVFVLFTLALYFFWRIAMLIWNSKRTAWLLLFLLAFCPRIFADAHYNSKDTVFMSLLIMGIYPALLEIGSHRWRRLIIAGVVLGLASTLRLVGFFVIPVFALVLLFQPDWRQLWKQRCLHIGVFVAAFLLSYYAFFPALWSHPIQGFANLVERITHFPWPHYTMLAGQWVGLDRMPWWYFPVWLVYTIPLAYSVLFLLGVVLFCIQIRKQASNPYLLFFVLLGTLVASYIVFTKPNLYDGWRQLQFLIVPFLLVAGIAIHRMLHTTFAQYIVWTVPILALIQTVSWHPHQYVYFNDLYKVTQKKGSFDQDYWYLSTKKAMQWIQEQHPKDTIHVFTDNTNTAWLNAFLIPKEPRNRLIIVNKREDAHYEIEPIRHSRPFDPSKNVVYSIIPGRDTICRVIQIKKMEQ